MKKYIDNLFRQYRQSEDGAVAVEFALVSMVFLLLVFGIMESGRLAWTMNGVRFAIEETSRYASLNPELPLTTFQDYAADKLDGMFIESGILPTFIVCFSRK